MNPATDLELIGQMVSDLLATDPSLFMVGIKIKPTNNIKVFVDGDQGISIEKCAALNRALYRKIEEAALYPDGNFSLEVSSPGLDEPLKSLRQYRKNKGRPIEVILNDGSKIEGTLTDVGEEGIELEEALGRIVHGRKPGKAKSGIKKHNILFDNIKTTKIQVVF